MFCKNVGVTKRVWFDVKINKNENKGKTKDFYYYYCSTSNNRSVKLFLQLLLNPVGGRQNGYPSETSTNIKKKETKLFQKKHVASCFVCKVLLTQIYKKEGLFPFTQKKSFLFYYLASTLSTTLFIYMCTCI